jgi:site-specific recombinase XerD
LIGIQRAHIELYIRHLGESGLRVSSVNTMMHGVRGFFRFAHIDGLIPANPAVYARLPKIYTDESRTQGLDRLELIRFLQVAQTLTIHHGALAFLLGINALRASEAAAVRIEDYQETLRGHRVLHLVGKGSKPATMPLTVPVIRVLKACRGQRTEGPLVLRPVSGQPIDRRDVYRMVRRIAKAADIPRHISPHSLRHAAITNALDAGVPLRDAQILAPSHQRSPSLALAQVAIATSTIQSSQRTGVGPDSGQPGYDVPAESRATAIGCAARRLLCTTLAKGCVCKRSHRSSSGRSRVKRSPRKDSPGSLLSGFPERVYRALDVGPLRVRHWGA